MTTGGISTCQDNFVYNYNDGDAFLIEIVFKTPMMKTST